MLVRKVDELFPVVGGGVVLARADMVADSPMNGLVDGRLFDDAELVTEQLIDGLSFKSGKKFPLGIRPFVILGGSNVDRTGGGQGNQHMLIHRTLVLFVIVLLEVFAKPVREGSVDPLDGLSKPAPADCQRLRSPSCSRSPKRNVDQEHPPTKRSCPNGNAPSRQPACHRFESLSQGSPSPDSNPKPNQRWKPNRQTDACSFPKRNEGHGLHFRNHHENQGLCLRNTLWQRRSPDPKWPRLPNVRNGSLGPRQLLGYSWPHCHRVPKKSVCGWRGPSVPCGCRENLGSENKKRELLSVLADTRGD